jgi:flagellar FliJ protein
MDPATLQLLIERATARCNAAQMRHAAQQRAAEQSRAHLAMLRQYTREYDERARCRAGDCRDPSAGHNQVAFMARLQVALATQERDVALRESAVATAAGELALCLQKRKSLETLALRRIEQERRVQARRDQKHTDEFAQRAHERAAAAGLHKGVGSAGRET